MRSKSPHYSSKSPLAKDHTAFGPNTRETVRVDTVPHRRYLAEKEGSAVVTQRVFQTICVRQRTTHFAF